MGALAHEAFCVEAMDGREEGGMGPQTLSIEQPSCHYLYSRQIPNWNSEAIRLGRLYQVFGELSFCCQAQPKVQTKASAFG